MLSDCTACLTRSVAANPFGTRPSGHHRLLMIKKKNQHERKPSNDNPALGMIEAFEKAHPEGIFAYANNLIALYAKSSLAQVNKYNAMSVSLSDLQEKKLLRLSLSEELEMLKKTNTMAKDIPDEDAMQEQELIPEEKNIPNRPNLVQEVKSLICDPKAGGITESSLNRMELFIIRLYEAVREYLNWMRRIILKIKNCNKIPRLIYSEVSEMIKDLNRNLKMSEDTSPFLSFDKDPMVMTRHSSHLKSVDHIYSSDIWELSYIEAFLEVNLKLQEK